MTLITVSSRTAKLPSSFLDDLAIARYRAISRTLQVAVDTKLGCRASATAREMAPRDSGSSDLAVRRQQHQTFLLTGLD